MYLRYVMLLVLGLQLLLQPWQGLAMPAPVASATLPQSSMTNADSQPHAHASLLHQGDVEHQSRTHDCCADADMPNNHMQAPSTNSSSSCQGDCGDCPQHCGAYGSLLQQAWVFANDLRETELLPFQALSIKPLLASPKRPPRV